MTLRGQPSREAICRVQLDALRNLLGEVAAGNPFYRSVLKKAGLEGGVGSLEEFVAQMPLTHKAALVDDQRRHPPYGSNLTYPLDRYCRFNQTSSTSGTPLRWLDTRESWQWMLDNWKQVYAAAGVRGGPQADCLYFAFSFGPFLGFWTAFEAATQLGCRAIPGGGLSSRERLEAIRDNRATVLLCTPSYALRLAEVAADEGLDCASMAIRTIVLAGEPGGSLQAVRRRIERAWPGASVFDHHGMTEVGPVTYQCPEKPGTLMVIESSYLAEIVDPDSDTPVARGEIGELVLTTLGRVGSPLIRYRTGDLVREDLEVAAKFGRHELALKGGIRGRVDDMVVVRGVNVFPSAVDDVLRAIPEVAEYRIEIESAGAMSELRLRVEPAASDIAPQALARRIATQMRSALHLRVPVTICPPNTLPRFEMKAKRWVIRS